MKPRKALPVLSALALLFTGTLHAQALRGRVVDRATGEPISAASLRVTGADGAVATGRSNEAGLFSIRLPAEGTYTLAGERLGYEDFTSPPVDVAPGATLEVQVRMVAATLALDSVGVRVRQVPAFRDVRAGAFYDRMEAGRGVYLSPEQIEQRRGTRTVDLLRTLRGVNVEGRSEVITMRSPRGRCVPTFYINGYRRLLFGSRLNDLIDRRRLWAMEVYERPWDAPPGFPASPENFRCGVIVIWTRDA